jgi:4'-phosphopantetheinyl transferase
VIPAAIPLAADAIHLHWLSYHHGDGRVPLCGVLARYLGIPTGDVPILQAAAHDKPRLATPHDWLGFNWSHTGDVAVVALARGLELGVDVERLDRDMNALEIARRFFAPAELVALQACNETDRNASFLKLWTAKEAVLKATGEGLAHGLQRIVLDVAGDHPRLRAVGDDSIVDWRLHRLSAPDADLVAALAWRGPVRRLLHFDERLSSSH